MKLTVPKTKTAQIIDFLAKKIDSGDLRPGDKLDSMRTLSAKFSVSTTTIRLVFDELERRRLIRTENSCRNVFVTNPMETSLRFLIIMQESTLESPMQYITPGFCSACRLASMEIDTILIDFFRSTPPEVMLEKLKQREYSGILLMCNNYNGDEPELALLHRLNVPVLLGHTNNPADTENTGFASLYLNESLAWNMAKDYLHHLGCNRIGAINYGKNVRGNMEGICSAVSLQLDDSFAPGFETWFRSQSPLDAVICYSDFFALRVYDWCKENHIAIPTDLKIMGICGYPGSELLSPPLSTIDFRYEDFGHLAAEILLKATNGSIENRQIELHPRLRKRNSTES